MVLTFREFHKDPTKYIQVHGIVAISNRGHNMKRFLEIYLSFDIETTTMPETHHGYMWCWQVGLNDHVIIGQKWSEFKALLEDIKTVLCLRKSTRVFFLVANLGFEFQFARHILNVTKVFAKVERQPIMFEVDECIEFRDALQISGGSLASLADQYTTTKKMVGDLDYSIIRNNRYDLFAAGREKELSYVVNDVKILTEYSKYLFDNYIRPMKWIPLTKTSLIRKPIKDGCSFDAHMEIYRCFPESYETYSLWMNYIFKGGFVHANINNANKIIEGMDGFDITSSYPYEILTSGEFPVSPFVETNEPLYNITNDDSICFMGIFQFIELRAKTPHSIESESKCVEISSKKIIDNGRIRYAESVTIGLTNLDFQIIEKYYTFDCVTPLRIWKAKKGYLPLYVRKPVADAYMEKAQLKREGKNGSAAYAEKKALVNSSFGMMCQKLILSDIGLDEEGEWIKIEKNLDWDKIKRKAFLLPQWGIFVTSAARYHLLNCVHKLQPERKSSFEGVSYCDTDSLKIHGIPDSIWQQIIEEENEIAANRIRIFCNKYSYNFDDFADLGGWDHEFHNVKGKFLGAKRYILTTEEGENLVTIAGLPKKALVKYCQDTGKDIYSVFNNGMIMALDVSGKNAHAYNDEPHTEIVDGVQMTELSSVGIFSIDFTLKMSSYYLYLIKEVEEENEICENRIH